MIKSASMKLLTGLVEITKALFKICGHAVKLGIAATMRLQTRAQTMPNPRAYFWARFGPIAGGAILLVAVPVIALSVSAQPASVSEVSPVFLGNNVATSKPETAVVTATPVPVATPDTRPTPATVAPIATAAPVVAQASPLADEFERQLKAAFGVASFSDTCSSGIENNWSCVITSIAEANPGTLVIKLQIDHSRASKDLGDFAIRSMFMLVGSNIPNLGTVQVVSADGSPLAILNREQIPALN